MKKLLIAFGGNAISNPRKREPVVSQIKKIEYAINKLKSLTKKYQLIITHGNGSEIGALLLQQERSKQILPEMPLDVLDAMTQGQLGYWIQQAVENNLRRKAATVVTRVLVDKKDPAFKNPTKPIGPYYAKKVFPHMIKDPEGWRRVVASPKPVKIVDIDEINSLVKQKFIVIACGGGGIPVIEKNGKFVGIEAVIDKDYTSAKLAVQLKAEQLIFLTGVPHVYLNYGKKDQKPIVKIKSGDAKILLGLGEFREGSMKPKIEASIEFLEHGGKKVIITSFQELKYALAGKGGTILS